MEGCLKKLVLEAEAMGFWGLGKSGWKPLAVSRRRYWAGSAQLKANGFILTSRRAKKLIPVYSRQNDFSLTCNLPGYLSTNAEHEFRDHLAEQEKSARDEGLTMDSPIQITGVQNLTSLLSNLWPDLGVTSSNT